MAKTQTHYVCQSCGRTSPRKLGKCPTCGSWDSFVEEILTPPPDSKKKTASNISFQSTPRRIKDIEGDVEERMHLPIEEFSRVLGGGIVPGSVVLISGDPGIGKSTLMLQTALTMAGEGTVLYTSGEESERQIKMRALRLTRKEGQEEANLPDNLLLVTETNLNVIMDHVRSTAPALLVIDSIQTMYMPELESAAGSVSQIRQCAAQLRELAKSSGIAVFIIGHVTKEGNIAGPRVLEHIVDTVLYLEGERYQFFRLLRSIKNRFGATSEVGVFEMGERGMIEVSNPSEAFLAERNGQRARFGNRRHHGRDPSPCWLKSRASPARPATATPAGRPTESTSTACC